jgi:hypothetical protein
MYDPHERIVELPKQSYVDLMVALESTEGWFDMEKHGLVLFIYDPIDGDSRKLIFKMKSSS